MSYLILLSCALAMVIMIGAVLHWDNNDEMGVKK